MKKFKKIFAIVLAMAMVLGMSVTAFADTQKGTITVNGLVEGKEVEVKVAKILTLNEAGNQWVFADGVSADLVGMTIPQMVNANAQDNAQNGSINTGLTNLNLKALTYSDYYTAEQIAADSTLKNSTNTGSIIFKDVEPGLYAIQAVDLSNEYIYSYMVAAVDYNNGVLENAVVQAKGQSNQPKKEIVNLGDASPASGDDVEFKITTYYPTFTQDATDLEISIEDTVTNAKIQYGDNNKGIVIPDGYGLEVLKDSTDTNLKIGLTGTYDPTKAGDKIEITYFVKVDAGLDKDATVSNKVVTTIPDKDGTDVSRQAIVELPTFSADIVKTNTNKETITTDTATFELYKVAEDGNVTTVKDGSEKKLVLVETKTTVNGVASFTGLASDEEYYVKETKAPEGFALDPDVYPLTGNISLGAEKVSQPTKVDGIMTVTTSYPDKSGNFDQVGFNDGLNFHDTTLSSLPSTGGIGTTIFTIGGCAIIIVAAGLFFASRRKKSA